MGDTGSSDKTNGDRPRVLTLVEAAEVVERLQARAILDKDREALKIGRDALLVLVSEGFDTLEERLRYGRPRR